MKHILEHDLITVHTFDPAAREIRPSREQGTQHCVSVRNRGFGLPAIEALGIQRDVYVMAEVSKG